MRVIPVLDLLNGRVVRGVAGRRELYRPVESRLTASAEPLEVARVFREQFGLTELYLADLDAITSDAPAMETYSQLAAEGFAVWIDAGVRNASRVRDVFAHGAHAVIVGSETLPGLQALRDIVATMGAERLVFSLDLCNGQPQLGDGDWPSREPLAIVRSVWGLGIRRLIVLDLTRVGVGTGTGTDSLCAAVRAAFPEIELIAGGGVRDRDDLRRLATTGLVGVLVASALHDGRLTRVDCLLREQDSSARGASGPQ